MSGDFADGKRLSKAVQNSNRDNSNSNRKLRFWVAGKMCKRFNYYYSTHDYYTLILAEYLYQSQSKKNKTVKMNLYHSKAIQRLVQCWAKISIFAYMLQAYVLSFPLMFIVCCTVVRSLMILACSPSPCSLFRCNQPYYLLHCCSSWYISLQLGSSTSTSQEFFVVFHYAYTWLHTFISTHEPTWMLLTVPYWCIIFHSIPFVYFLE